MGYFKPKFKKRKRHQRNKKQRLSAAEIQRALISPNTYSWDRCFAIDVTVQNSKFWQVLPDIMGADYINTVNDLTGLRAIGASLTGTDSTDTSTADHEYHYIKTVQKTVITNLSHHACIVELYECTARNHMQTASTAGTVSNQGLVTSIMKDAAELLHAGWDVTQAADDVKTAGDGTYVVMTLDTHRLYSLQRQTPYNSHDFCSRFKIEASKRIHMPPGAKIKVKLTAPRITWDRRFDSQVAISTAGQNPMSAYGGNTKFILLSVIGDLGKQNDNNALVGTMKCTLGIEMLTTGEVYKSNVLAPNHCYRLSDKPTVTGTLEGPSAFSVINEGG